MAIIQFVISSIIVGLLYLRMIKRETPAPISKARAIVPVILGVVSILLSFILFIIIGLIVGAAGYVGENYPTVVRSFVASLVSAGLPEEAAKLMMIIIAAAVFRSKIGNVYEYILTGAGVGLGFTLFEEFLYGSESLLTAVGRLITVAAHMLFGVIMAKHLGLARYYKMTGKGSAAGQIILAVIVPVMIHTLYDACTAHNMLLASTDEALMGIGAVLAIGAFVVMFVLQFIVLGRLKKNTEKYCEMRFAVKNDI